MAKKNKLALAHGLLAMQHLLTGRPQSQLPASLTVGCIVIYSTTALGDLMFNTPAIAQLRRCFPQARLVLVVHQKYIDLVQDYADVDQVLCWDGRFARLPAFVRQLRPLRPELAVILHSRAPYDVLSAAWAGCRWIVRDEAAMAGGAPLRRWLVAASDNQHAGHVIQRKLDLISALGGARDQVAMRVPCAVDAARFRQAGKVRIGFQLGASGPARCWPVERFVALAEALLAGYPERQIVLMGIASEQPLAEQFLSALPAEWQPQVQSLVGQTSVKDAFDVVASLDLLVTGDTGPLHLAIALQVPTVSLFVTADPGLTGPYQDPQLHTVLHAPLGETVDAAIRAAPMRHLALAPVLAAARLRLDSMQTSALPTSSKESNDC